MRLKFVRRNGKSLFLIIWRLNTYGERQSSGTIRVIVINWCASFVLLFRAEFHAKEKKTAWNDYKKVRFTLVLRMKASYVHIATRHASNKWIFIQRDAQNSEKVNSAFQFYQLDHYSFHLYRSKPTCDSMSHASLHYNTKMLFTAIQAFCEHYFSK